MRTIEVQITGATPMIVNAFNDEAAIKLDSNSSSTIGYGGTPHDQCAKKLYIDSNGNAVWPSHCILRAIIEGGKYHKHKGKQLTNKKNSQLYGCLRINELELPIVSKDGWTVDSRSAVIPKTQGRIMVHRPKFNDWSLKFTIELDDTLFEPKLIYSIVETTGKRIGIGAFRPDCKGPFGCFNITSWIEKVEGKIKINGT